MVAAPFTIAKTWKQPKSPSAEEWIKKVWCVCAYIFYIMEYYSAIKNEIMPFTATWMDLEINILSRTEKDKYDIAGCGI